MQAFKMHSLRCRMPASPHACPVSYCTPRQRKFHQSVMLNARSPSTSSACEDLELQLQSLPGMSAVLPGNDLAKQRIMHTITAMELQNPCPNPLQASSNINRSSSNAATASSSLNPVKGLLGDWELVYASNGTVVTRTQFAQYLTALPGFGLNDVLQRLSVDDEHPGCIRTTNQAEFGLGPFGSWRVGIKGTWRAAGAEHTDNTAVVEFDEFSIKLCGFLGAKLPQQMPEVRIPLPGSGNHGNQQQEQQQQQSPLRPAALWVTSYLDGKWRVGRGGSSGNVFLFKRRKQE